MKATSKNLPRAMLNPQRGFYPIKYNSAAGCSFVQSSRKIEVVAHTAYSS